MGLNAGWIALYSGVAAEADIILLPEFKFDYAAITNKLIDNIMQGKNYQIVVVAEGAEPEGQKAFRTISTDRANLLGGVSGIIMDGIKSKLGPESDIDMRNLVLGHTQRGGAPNAGDRILAQRFGQAAVQAIIAKNFNKMVALHGDKIELVDIKEAVKSARLITEDAPLVKTALDLGISLGF
jgi:6-phosphofructokinase 1